jgi:hypothetical protein
MRYVFGFLGALALSLMLSVGYSEGESEGRCGRVRSPLRAS